MAADIEEVTASGLDQALVVVGSICLYVICALAGVYWGRLIAARLAAKFPGAWSRHAPQQMNRRIFAYLYVQTRWGVVIDVLQTVLSLVSCAVYVIETYQKDFSESTLGLTIELGTGIAFVSDYLLRWLMAWNRFGYVLSLNAMVDVLTIAPSVTSWMSSDPNSQRHSYLRIVRILKLFRIMRSLRLVKASNSAVYGELASLCLSLLCLIFTAAGVYQVFESEVDGEPLPFHTALYWCVIEVLGRPRIPAVAPEAFFVMIIVVVFSVIIIPKHIAKLLTILAKDSYYRHDTFPKDRDEMVFYVITGFFDLAALQLIIYEMLHPSRLSDSLMQVVLLFNQHPPRELESLLQSPEYQDFCTYIYGNALSERDLDRCRVHEAAAVMVIANKYAKDPEIHDAEILAMIKSIKFFNRRMQMFPPDGPPKHADFFARHMRIPGIQVVAQVLRPETRDYLVRHPWWERHDIAIVPSEFTFTLLSLNAKSPGLATVLCNLFMHTELMSQDAAEVPEWYKLYERGAARKLVKFHIPPGSFLLGLTLKEATAALSEVFNIPVLACEVQTEDTEESGEVVQSEDSRRQRKLRLELFPGTDMELAVGSRLFISLPGDQRIAKAAMCKSRDDFLRYRDAVRQSRERDQYSHVEVGITGGGGHEEVIVGRHPTHTIPHHSSTTSSVTRRAGRASASGITSESRITSGKIQQSWRGWKSGPKQASAKVCQRATAMQDYCDLVAAPLRRTSTDNSTPQLTSSRPHAVRRGHVILVGKCALSSLQAFCSVLAPDQVATVVLHPEAQEMENQAADVPWCVNLKSKGLLHFVKGGGARMPAKHLYDVSVASSRAVVVVPDQMTDAQTAQLMTVDKSAGPDATLKGKNAIVDTTTMYERHRLQTICDSSGQNYVHQVTLLHSESLNSVLDDVEDLVNLSGILSDSRWGDIVPITCTPLFASGMSVCDSLVERFQVEVTLDPTSVILLDLLLAGDSKGVKVHEREVDEFLMGKPYHEAVGLLLEENVLVLGLRRELPHATKFLHRQKVAISVPDDNTVLRTGDTFFALGAEPVKTFEVLGSTVGVLEVKIISASGLPSAEPMLGSVCAPANPYCRVKVADQSVDTSAKPQTSSPVWDEAFTLNVRTMEDPVHFEVFDSPEGFRLTIDEFLGAAQLEFEEVAALCGKEKVLKLTNSSGKGTLTIQATFTPTSENGAAATRASDSSTPAPDSAPGGDSGGGAEQLQSGDAFPGLDLAFGDAQPC
mmetsp:Transcript_87631/g.200195  ORF Transcript_87631/g.200195 Transcript_87631/m.200195 type:complete len:1241 (+) Transcript_87631:15-3737(+)